MLLDEVVRDGQARYGRRRTAHSAAAGVFPRVRNPADAQGLRPARLLWHASPLANIPDPPGTAAGPGPDTDVGWVPRFRP